MSSRYKWPEDKAERLAIIRANLRMWIPPGRPKRGKGRIRKDAEELELDDELEKGEE